MIRTRSLRRDGPTSPPGGSELTPVILGHTPEYTCPDCGHTLVPTDECVPDLRLEHRCQAPPSAAPAAS